tara:strand:- start:190 stop:618 length:429 start_codon:yes stop_codon:yes gene_type:complete
MEIALLLIGLFILGGVGYILFKLNQPNLNQENSDKRDKELDKMREMLSLEFKNLANEIFDEKTKKIGEVNKENLSSILDPLRENIERFERKVELTNKDALEFNTILKSEINHLKNETLKMRDDANNLANALRGESKTHEKRS